MKLSLCRSVALAFLLTTLTYRHTARGVLVFGVNQCVAGVARPTLTVVTIPPREVLLRKLNYGAPAVMVGLLLTASLILRPTKL